jgi:hypothetical protein
LTFRPVEEFEPPVSPTQSDPDPSVFAGFFTETVANQYRAFECQCSQGIGLVDHLPEYNRAIAELAIEEMAARDVTMKEDEREFACVCHGGFLIRMSIFYQ